jgi:hypothetical protein
MGQWLTRYPPPAIFLSLANSLLASQRLNQCLHDRQKIANIRSSTAFRTSVTIRFEASDLLMSLVSALRTANFDPAEHD